MDKNIGLGIAINPKMEEMVSNIKTNRVIDVHNYEVEQTSDYLLRAHLIRVYGSPSDVEGMTQLHMIG